MSSSSNIRPYTINAPLKVTNTATSTSKTTGASIITGGLGVSGPTFINSLNTDGASKINVMATADGSSGGPGLYMYDTSNNQFAIYCGSSGAGKSFSGGNAVAGVAGGTAQQIRIRTNNNALNGIVFENAAEQLLMGIGGDTGNTTIGGTLAIASTFTVGSASATTGKYLTILNDAGALEFAVIKTATNFSTSSLTGDTVMKSLANRLLFQSGSGAAAMIVNASNNVSILTTTASTTTTTGALTVAGGVGVAGAINAGTVTAGPGSALGNTSFDGGHIYSGTASPMVLDAWNGSPLIFRSIASNNFATFVETMTLSASGDLTIKGTTASTTTGTGALTVAGGLGVAGSTYLNSLSTSGEAVFKGTLAVSPIGNGVFLGLDNNYAGMHLTNVDGGYIDFAVSGTDGAGRIIYGHSNNTMSLQTDGTNRLNLNSVRLQVLQTTASTSSTTGALTVAGGLGVAGVINAFGGAKLSIQNNVDGGSTRGIFMWDDTDTKWGIYMASSGASKSLAGGTAIAGGVGGVVSQHSIRFRSDTTSLGGFIFENSAETLAVSISSYGDMYLPNTTPSTSTTSGTLVVAGGVGVAGGINVGGTVTGIQGSTPSFNSGLTLASSHNMVLVGNNDTGTKLVVFVSGSTKSDDGGINSATIRNDGGLLILGNAGFGTVIPSPLTVSKTTASTSTTTGALTVAGGLGVAGSTYLTGLRVQGGSKINVMATLDGSNGGNGLYMYDYSNTQFGIYCGSSGATKSFGGGTAVAGVGGGTAQQIRIRVNDNALNGILFENTSETILFGVNGSTGNAVISGNLAVAGTTASTSSTTGALTVAGGLGVAGNIVAGGTLQTGKLFINYNLFAADYDYASAGTYIISITYGNNFDVNVDALYWVVTGTNGLSIITIKAGNITATNPSGTVLRLRSTQGVFNSAGYSASIIRLS
jgi:hypothetical protein